MSILKRSTPHTLKRRFKEAVWPTMGWDRVYHYYRHRLFRAGDSTYRITAGLAMGAAVSFNPFLGTHSIQGILFSWMIQASMLAGWVGTVFGNPTTFPFIFWLTYKVGVSLCHLVGLGEVVTITDENMLDGAAAIAQSSVWSFFVYMYHNPLKLFLPLVVGGVVCGALSWPLFYALLYYPVRGAQRAYVLQRKLRHKLRQEKSSS